MAAPNPLPPDLQSLFDTLVADSAATSSADAAAAAAAVALTTAQANNATAQAAQLAAHQAVTSDAAAFITQFQKDFPTS